MDFIYVYIYCRLNRMKKCNLYSRNAFSSFVIRAGDISKYVLDNYLIPCGTVGECGGPDISHALQCSFVE